MTTVQEELEQPIEEVEITKEDNFEKSNRSGCAITDNILLPDQQTTHPTSVPTLNFKEKLGYDKNSLSCQSSNANNHTKPQCTLKSSSSEENQIMSVTTVPSNSAVCLQPVRYPSAHSSNIQNPSSSPPTMQAITATQVAATTVSTSHGSGQVCVLFHYSNNSSILLMALINYV